MMAVEYGCPQCQSMYIVATDRIQFVDAANSYQPVQCNNCGKSWRDIFDDKAYWVEREIVSETAKGI